MSRQYQPYSDFNDHARPDLNSNLYSSNQVPPSQQYNQNAWGNNQYPPAESTDSVIPKPLPFVGAASAGYSPVTAQDFRNTSYTTNNNEMSYNDGGNTQGALWSAEKPRSAASNKKKWLIIGGIAAVIVIAIGVGVGVAVSKKSPSSSSSSTSGNGGTVSTGDQKDWVMSFNSVVKYNPKDLSQFNKDTRLIRSMYGVAYTPLGAILPDCGATFDQVLEDVYLLSQLTKNVRLYGTDCNATDLVLDAIQQAKLDLSVYLGIYINQDETVYDRQRDAVKRILQTYDTSRIAGVTVGNEFILNNVTAAGEPDANGAAGLAAGTYLASKVADVRSMISSLSLSKTIPVGNGDAGSYTNTIVLNAVDYFFSNIHPWFGSVSVTDAATWTWQFLQNNNVNLVAETTNKPELWIAEIGWPSNSTTAAAATDGPSSADVATLQTFMNEWVCPSNANSTKYFYFELMDQPWKTATYGGVEGYWGIFDSNKKLKDVTIPDCPIS